MLHARLRRVVEAKRSRLRAKLERLVASANRRRPENQPKLTVEDAEKLAEDCVSSALARAQEHCAENGLPPAARWWETFHHFC